MIVTNDQQLHEKIALFRNHGAKPKYFHRYVGGNFRLDPIQAAVLLVKLPHLEEWSATRRRNAGLYNRLFAGTAVVVPCIRPDCVSCFNQYVIHVDDRDDVVDALKQAGVSTEIYYPLPLHLQECFASMFRCELPASEHAAGHVIALPIYPELAEEMIHHVARTLISASVPIVRVSA